MIAQKRTQHSVEEQRIRIVGAAVVERDKIIRGQVTPNLSQQGRCQEIKHLLRRDR